MTSNNLEKKDDLVQLNGRVPREIRDAYRKTILKGVSSQHVITAVFRLWVSMPKDIQKELIIHESTGTKKKNVFEQAVRSIVKKELQNP